MCGIRVTTIPPTAASIMQVGRYDTGITDNRSPPEKRAED